MYPYDKLLAPLPELLTFADGSPVRTAADWAARRAEIFDAAVQLEQGGMPPSPEFCRAELLHAASGSGPITYRIFTGTNACPVNFTMQVYLPAEADRTAVHPAVVCGDGCWDYFNTAVVASITARGMAAVRFNRTELAPDIGSTARDSGIYRTYPGSTFSAIAAWAWGYHRVIDVLLTLPFIDPKHIAVAGHSRGGKAVLLAGATDERIAYTAPNNSGAHGCGCYRYEQHECIETGDHFVTRSEQLADLVRVFPDWLGPDLPAYAGREADLPHDMHFFKAFCAPRCLIMTEALGDIWANPRGSKVSTAAARPVYELLGCDQNLVQHYRAGVHAHGVADIAVLLDVMDAKRTGAPVPQYDDPFPELG